MTICLLYLPKVTYATVLDRLPPIKESVRGGALEPRVANLEAMAHDMARFSRQLADNARIVLSTGTKQAQFVTVKEQINERVAALPKLSDGAELRVLAQALELVGKSVDVNSFAAERELLEAVNSLPEQDAAVKNVIEARKRRLQIREDSIARRIEQARTLVRQGKYADAQKDVEALTKTDELRRSSYFNAAQEILADLKERERKRAESMLVIVQAMEEDNAEQVALLARQMGLPRLPLAIRSEPAGATIRRGEQILGVTPLVLNDLRAERVDDRYQLELDGYNTVTVSPLDAVGGWRLAVNLQRATLREAQIPGPLTSQPAAIGEDLWFAGRSHAIKLAADNSLAQLPFESTRVLEQPIYAPVTERAGLVLVTTRDQAVLAIDGDQINSWYAPVATNFPVISYVSPLVIDRRVIVAGGIDGRLAAGDATSGDVLWEHAGARFAHAPVINQTQVSVTRVDGSLLTVAIEEGDIISSRSVGASCCCCLDRRCGCGWLYRHQAMALGRHRTTTI